MRTKQLFKTRLLSFAALCCLALAAVSCANEDIAQNDTGSDNNKDFTTFVASEPTKTRTSMDYATGKFYWEEGDKIYVKDDDGTLQVSNAVDAAHAHSESFSFRVPGKFNNSATYKVYYLGKNGSGTIPIVQTQTKPNDTEHIGEFGDYGTATANGPIGGGRFHFQLEHQSTILVFQPYTSSTVLKNCYLSKIEVSSDNDIAETYTIDPVTGNLTNSAGAKQIVLTTHHPYYGTTYYNGFPLTNSSPSVATNGAYMVIKSGVHTLKVRYWVKDIVTGVEGTVTKILPSFNYSKNTYYDMTANLNVRKYDGNNYYMWDAKQQYWYGYEWTKSLPAGQPTQEFQTSSNYAQNNSDNRWYNEDYSPSGPNDASKNALFTMLPNANEMAWYIKKGDPRWDADEIWEAMGHLYKGGMWFKKKSKIPGFTNAHIPDGTFDLRTSFNTVYNFSLKPGLPSVSEIGDYFYLPALGYYNTYMMGKLSDIGREGRYWASSGITAGYNVAYALTIAWDSATMGSCNRDFGIIVQKFE